MKKFYALSVFLFLTFSVGISFAQWNILTTGTTGNLYSVDYKSDGTVWIGAGNGIFYSTNYAASLQFKTAIDTTLGNAPIYGSFYDIYGFSPTTAVATGVYNIGNDELIYKTSSSGSGWDFTHSNNTAPLPRYLNDIDFENASTGIVVGNSGRVLKTINTGANWSVLNSGTNSVLYAISNVAPSVYVASGVNIILRTTNGGNSWTAQSFTGSFAGLGFSGDTGYAASDAGDILKSNDQGATWSTMNSFSTSISSFYVIDANKVLLAANNDLYISKDGGQSWEQFKLSGYSPLNKISFYDFSNGIAVGDNGYAIKTTNINNTPSFPISSFSIQATSPICIGDSITLINSTAPLQGYSYQWQTDNSTFDTQYNPGIVVLNAPGPHVISLIVTNANGSDTAFKQITVIGHELQSFTMLASSDSVCIGNYTGFSVPNSQTGVSYQLRKGFVNVGAAKNGNGGTLLFSSLSGITAPTGFNIKALKINNCFIDSLIQYDTIYIAAGSSPAVACIPSSNNSGYGITNILFNTINNTTPTSLYHYIDYSCQLNTSLLLGNSYPLSITINGSSNYRRFKVWIDFDNNGTFNMTNEMVFYISGTTNTVNGNITIPSNLQFFNLPIRMRVAFDDNAFTLDDACWDFSSGEIEDYSVTILPAPVLPAASFSYTSSTICFTEVNFSNTTYNATSYLWDFGDSSSSTLLNPSHTYNLSGAYTATLIASNSLGTDTFYQVLNIQNPLVPDTASCDPTAYPYSCDRKEITYVSLNGMNSWSSSNTFYEDFTCTKQVHIVKGSSYVLYYSATDIISGTYTQYTCPWIDYNNDGIFNDTDERLYSGNLGGGPIISLPFTVPSTAVTNVPLRLRILASDKYIPTNCTPVCGQYEDYTLFIDPSPPMSVIFSANPDTACINTVISFVNSTQNAVSYLWDFGDGDTSSLFNPSHKYTAMGTYSVKLKACNSSGNCDSILKTNYIAILPLPAVSLILNPDIVCINTAPYTLTGGSPNGGIYTGTGVSTGNFNPNAAGSGLHDIVYSVTDTNNCTNSDTAKIDVDLCAGIQTIISNETILIFPNPSFGIFTLQSPEKKYRIEITNVWGEIFYSIKTGSDKVEINLSDQQDGFYFLHIKSEQGTAVKKIIVNR